MSERTYSGEELGRWTRDLTNRLREVIEESLSLLLPELDRLVGGGYLERDGYLYARVILPGCDKQSLNVSVKERSVEITAQPSEVPFPEAKELQPLKKQVRRTLNLPRAVIPEQSEARYVDGILYLKLKIAEERGVRIKVE